MSPQMPPTPTEGWPRRLPFRIILSGASRCLPTAPPPGVYAMRTIVGSALVLAASACFGFLALRAEPPARATDVPLFAGLGKHTRPGASASAEAQRYVDQGLNFLFAFNHDEAIRAFRRAAALDPACALAHWGVALANGRNYNYPAMPPD